MEIRFFVRIKIFTLSYNLNLSTLWKEKIVY